MTSAVEGVYGGWCQVHGQPLLCLMCTSIVSPPVSLFQFGAFLKWTCAVCNTEIYATTDSQLKYLRNDHEQSCKVFVPVSAGDDA